VIWRILRYSFPSKPVPVNRVRLLAE